MSEELHAVIQEARALMLDPRRLVRARAGGRRRGSTPSWSRVELRPVVIKAGEVLQVVTYDERQAHTTNVRWGKEAEDALDELLAEPFSHWHVATTQQELGFRVTKAGKVLVTRGGAERTQSREHDRVKHRLVEPDAEFLHALGVSTRDGRVKAAKRDKYHQIEEFVRVLDSSVTDAVKAGRLPVDRPLRIVDLGCGNAYLTFAAYHHLAEVRGLSVELLGVDAKAQAREHNQAVARGLGVADRVVFVEGAIGEVQVDLPVDVVLALHACDTATDDALARAVGWQAPLVLAAPCCHHDLQRQLKGREPAEPYGLVTRNGLLRERFVDVLTDAFRAHLLRTQGYRTDVVEFVDTRHTPRNVLLRAHRTGAQPSAQQLQEYQSLVESWGIAPYLSTLLTQPS